MEVSEFDPQPLCGLIFQCIERPDFCKKVIRKFNKDERNTPVSLAGGYTQVLNSQRLTDQ